MAVLLGAVSKFKSWEEVPTFDKMERISVHKFLDLKKNAKNQNDIKENGKSAFYIVYKGFKDVEHPSGNKYKRAVSIVSPIFQGVYDGEKSKKQITQWIKSIKGDPKAQYLRLSHTDYSISDFKRGYKAK